MFNAVRDDANINFTDLTLTLVFRCNYRCPSCLVGDKLTSSESLSFEDAKQIIDSAASLRSFNSIAFVGGEPFLVYPLMVRLSEYVFNRYGRVALSASTNSYWAKSVDIAVQKLGPLVNYGLHSLLLSWDDFHAKFGTIQQVANAIEACNAFGVQPTVQNIVLKDSIKIESIKEQLARLCDISKVDWAESACTPVGLGADIPQEYHRYIPIDELDGGCTAGQILNIEANGDAKPCCGSGLMARGLTMGNTRHQTIKEIVRKGSADPLFNALVAYKGPKFLIRTLREAGRDDLVPDAVTDVCDACFKITNNEEAMTVLRHGLTSSARQLLFSRAVGEAYETFQTISHYKDGEQSVFYRTPGFDTAGTVESGSVHTLARSAATPQLLVDFVTECAPNLEKWSNVDYLKNKAGAAPVLVAVRSKASGNKVSMKLSTYLERVTHPAYAIRGRDMYLSEQPVPVELADDFTDALSSAYFELMSRQRDTESAQLSQELMMFVGRFTYTDCHEHGGYDALMIQVVGDKEVLLYAPTEENTRALYIDNAKYKNWSPIHMCAPNLTGFPDFASSKPTHVKVLQGQALFIPDGWYHAVASIGDGVTITTTLFTEAAGPRPQRRLSHTASAPTSSQSAHDAEIRT